MQILNTKNPEDIAKIFPWLVPTETETRMEIAAELYCRLKNEPDNVLLLVAIERNITRAVLIAHVSDKKKKRIWLWQCQAEPGFRYSKLMFEGLRQWSKSKGCRRIYAGVSDTYKRPIFKRKYGFKIKGKEIYYDVA